MFRLAASAGGISASITIIRPIWGDVLKHYAVESHNDNKFLEKYFGNNHDGIEPCAACVSIALIKSGMTDEFNAAKNDIEIPGGLNKILDIKEPIPPEKNWVKIIGTAEGLYKFLREDAEWGNPETTITNPSGIEAVHNEIAKSSSDGLYMVLGLHKNIATLWLDRKKDMIYEHERTYPRNYTVHFWELKSFPPDECWILSTGDRVYWHGGNYGNKGNLIDVFDACSGTKGYQNAKYQQYEDKGPTIEGEYELNLAPEITEARKNETGNTLLRNEKAGIESIPKEFERAWGAERIRLKPKKVSQPEGGIRDLNSFYFHDSKKHGSMGCTEVESRFFEVLKEYRTKMINKGIKDIKIKVMVKYPNDKHITSCIENE